MSYDKLIFELDVPGACGVTLEDVKPFTLHTGLKARESVGLPSVSESDVVRHYVSRSAQNYCVQNVLIHLLGSCTMKFNPPAHEFIAGLDGFAHVHPLQPEETVQGCLEVIYELQRLLARLTQLPSVSLLPAAGAHGELVSLQIIRAYHEYVHNSHKNIILIPDSAHGTNPASAAACGYKIINVKSDAQGMVDIEHLTSLMTDDVAALMITNPNTCGVFESQIEKIADIVHSKGALLYCDGANFNAIVGKISPMKLGVDIMHLNLHKTFAAPHGGGGPGGGVICATDLLDPYMPVPVVSKDKSGKFTLNTDRELSIGYIMSFHGHFGVIVKALSYILSLGDDIKYVAENSTLNANYLLSKLSGYYNAPFGKRCMHECLLTDEGLGDVTTNDIAKCLIDCGIHPMTIYFPLVVKGAMLIEPTETETKRTLDKLIERMIEIARQAKSGNKDYFADRPRTTPVRKVDETLAARKPKLVWRG